jgi:hypothetical protein
MPITDSDSECGHSILRTHFQKPVTSKQMIGKGPRWSHSLCFIELFPDLTNFLNSIHRELRSNNFHKSIAFFVTRVVDMNLGGKVKP